MEQSAILTTNVDNSSSQEYQEYSTWNNGNNTQDRIFLLSYAEANRYFEVTDDDNIRSRVAPTAYACSQGASAYQYQTADGELAGWWWLRSRGTYADWAAVVWFNGTINSEHMSSKSIVVRPVLWLDLESDYFYQP